MLGIAVAIALARRGRELGCVRSTEGGFLMADVASTDRFTGFFLRPLFDRIAAEIAAIAPVGGSVLDVGCGPGHLAIRLARDLDLEVTALDLDPAMIAQAIKNANRLMPAADRPVLVVGSVDYLPFADETFDVVVSTFSSHHWANPKVGLTEIGRVLRPGGRAIIWDFKPGMQIFGTTMPDIGLLAAASSFDAVAVTPWRFPWRLSLVARTELVRRLPAA
jgi:SAM-dependent methyltransferase